MYVELTIILFIPINLSCTTSLFLLLFGFVTIPATTQFSTYIYLFMKKAWDTSPK